MLIESLFSFKTQLLEMSKRKQVQCSLSSFFGGKQNQESNTTPAPPAATPIKKTRKFQESWKEKYRWLHFDEKENKMFCEFCREFPNGKNTHYSLRVGTNNFQTDSLKAHEASEGHAMSLAAKRASERPREQRPLPAALSRLDEETLKKMEYLFNTAYYIAYLKLPFSIFSQLCSLQKKNGLNLGNTYMNDHACKEFCKHISDTLRADLIDSLSTAKFISIMADGATDVSCLEEEIVYVRFVSGGAPKTCYVELAEVESAKAPGILKAIKSVMDKIDPQWMQKLISTGTDGASVTMGRIGGVVSLIKQQAPQVIPIHCVAHNLELAFSDTLKCNETMMSIKELLNGCWKHYKYSPKALRELREMAEAMEIKVGKPTKASGTRWVPHLLRALTVLLQKNFQAIVSHFEHTAEARDSSAEMQGRGRNLSKKLKAYKFQLHLHLMWDILEEVSKISLIFQKDSISILQVKAEIERASQALENMRRRPGKHLAAFQEEVGAGTVFKGVSLTRNNTDDRLFEQSKASIITDAKQFLASRFEVFTSPVLKACGVITNNKSWPKERNDLGLYGEEELVTVAQHFQAVLRSNAFDLEVSKDQWLSLKLYCYDHKRIANLSQAEFCVEVFNQVHPDELELSHMLMVVEICLAMAVSSSCCERGFSCMGRLKSEYRNSLDVETVDMLMNICLNGSSPEDFTAERAILHWNQASQRMRRPCLKD